MISGLLTWDLDLGLLTMVFWVQVGRKWVGGGGNVHYFLLFRDPEKALGKHLGELFEWMSERGLGVAWTHFETPGDVWGWFWPPLEAPWDMREVLGTVLMHLCNLGGSTGQGNRKDNNT